MLRNTLPLYKRTTIRFLWVLVMHARNIRQRKRLLQIPWSESSASRTNCHHKLPTREHLSGGWPRCAAVIYAPQSPLPISSVGRGGQPDLQVSSRYHQSLWNFGRYTTDRLLRELLAARSGKPGAHLMQVAANPADLSIGKHTHTSSRPTCYTSQPKNNISYL